MIAFDTSLVVRIAVGDNQEQRAAALALVDEHRVLIPKSVVLETEWVLRARYGLTPAEIIEFLAFLLGSEGVVMEDEAAVRGALTYYQHGADFADALHLGSVGDTPLYTLDKAFCKRAIQKGLAPKVVLVRPGNP
ncbi:MAG: type II toxin-antitoxin system VapC family toxin [Gammaproteobacteria bacterium]